MLEIALAAGVPLATGVTVPVTLAVALGVTRSELAVDVEGTAVGVPSAPKVGSAGAKTGVAEASD